MVIVTLGSLPPSGRAARRNPSQEQGIDVLVDDAEEIYNEYSSGAFSAMAIRRFVKMLYDRNPRKAALAAASTGAGSRGHAPYHPLHADTAGARMLAGRIYVQFVAVILRRQLLQVMIADDYKTPTPSGTSIR